MTTEIRHLTLEELKAGLPHILEAPKNEGRLELLIRRPDMGEREVLDEAELDLELGLIGDNWKTRGSKRTKDGSAHPEMQLNIMMSRSIALIAQDKERWPLAGDQMYVDIDLSHENLPLGTQLSIGTAIIEITEPSHNGCLKFVDRFGKDSMKFVNAPEFKKYRLRGVNAKVIKAGVVKAGDMMRKLTS